MPQPNEVGRIVIIDGDLSRTHTTLSLYLTIEMLSSRMAWASAMALAGAQILTAVGFSLAGRSSWDTLYAVLAVSLGGVVLRGVQSWLTSRRWRKIMEE